MRRSTYIAWGCIALLIGLFIAKYTTPLSAEWLIVCLVLIPFVFIPSKVRLVALIVLCLIIGWWRGGVQQQSFQAIAADFNQTVTIQGYVLEDATYSYNGQLETVVRLVTLQNQPQSGAVTLRSINGPTMYRNDFIEATGKLRPTKGGKQATMAYADVTVLSHGTSVIDTFRRNFIVGMQNALPEPAASFGIGLLVGQRSLLPDDISGSLQIAGLTHIVAVSGYNLTIIINAVRRGGKRLSRFQIVAIAAALIYAFLLITGFSPSIVRASLVSGLGLLAWYYGRTFRPIVLILLVAALTAFYNPYYVWGDIGWYLSFFAFYGVLVIAPLFMTLLTKNKKELSILPSVAIESFSAQIMTIPLVMYIFGTISIIGFVANIVIVPLVPFAMAASAIAGLGGLLLPEIAGWIALPARVLLNSMLNIANWLASVPNAMAALSIGVAGMVAMYGIIAIVTIGLNKRTQSVIIKDNK